MLIRAAAVTVTALTITACGVATDPYEHEPSTDEIDQALMCELHMYRCYPGRAGADETCSLACGRPGHCQDYTPGEYIWCELHPSSCRFGFRCCDPWGNPAWDMYCVPGLEP
ncbi:MAG TPA: hypothetical protein VF516_27725 [Kofleriaceae bacterium]